MTTGDWAFFLLTITVSACAVVCWIAWHVAYTDGYNDGRDYERGRRAERRIRDNRRQAAGARSVGVPPWYHIVEPRRTAAPPPGPAQWHTMLLSDTGEFRALAAAGTDRYIGRMQAEEESYRQALTA